MKQINFNGKTFSLVANSTNGKANAETIFKYHQEGNLVTADYYGGSIRYGKIIAELKGHQLHMLYQCMTTDNTLKAGKAMATIGWNQHNKIKLTLDWEWLGENKGNGTSEYIEN